MIIVVNDNGRSYDATIGGLARRLAAVCDPSRLRAVPRLRQATPAAAAAGRRPAYATVHGVKRGMKDVLSPKACSPTSG